VIKAVIFDLDGTLVKTEKLKAISYARAAVQLRPDDITEDEVVEAFKEVVGRSRQEVSEFLMERFDLKQQAALRTDELGVDAPWEAFAQVRLKLYEETLADPATLLTHQWPHNMDLLREVFRGDCLIGLATMSHRGQVKRVLDVLGLEDIFDYVATRDDVEEPKPNPEIYLLVARELGVRPRECLVVEDSYPGVESAMAAGMSVIAVTTPFTRTAFQNQNLLEQRWVVNDPNQLCSVLRDSLTAY